ncbi:hypothetical protein KK171_12590 [Pseudomonas aeruginosa]|uniref:hypothetical protein n=1 Tax=Pseudomonas aeruginosa TaxID=287 RepID=UPI002358FFAF|nr:hypothetical protein KK192_12595 [Pseudomonas aeruginosa]WCX55617.1 hypothetical protein KK217_12590 [Pseudomonas aeruginosa]WCX73899.1 hypothetical protein KK171_12590 [Pseudomonas aeruginosa]
MQGNSLNILKLVDHPKLLTRRVNIVALNLEKVGYSQEINDLANARCLTMPEIWSCLKEGEVQSDGLSVDDDEVSGVIAYHSHEGLVRLRFSLLQDDSWLEVLSAKLEVK